MPPSITPTASLVLDGASRIWGALGLCPTTYLRPSSSIILLPRIERQAMHLRGRIVFPPASLTNTERSIAFVFHGDDSTALWLNGTQFASKTSNNMSTVHHIPMTTYQTNTPYDLEAGVLNHLSLSRFHFQECTPATGRFVYLLPRFTLQHITFALLF